MNSFHLRNPCNRNRLPFHRSTEHRPSTGTLQTEPTQTKLQHIDTLFTFILNIFNFYSSSDFYELEALIESFDKGRKKENMGTRVIRSKIQLIIYRSRAPLITCTFLLPTLLLPETFLRHRSHKCKFASTQTLHFSII